MSTFVQINLMFLAMAGGLVLMAAVVLYLGRDKTQERKKRHTTPTEADHAHGKHMTAQ